MESIEEKPASSAPKTDRKLGDEWEDWNGEAANDVVEEKKTTFLWVAFAAAGIIAALSLFTWYMIIPRLEQFHSVLPMVIGGGIIGGILLLALVLLSITITAITEKGYLASCVRKNFLFSFLVPLAVQLGNRFGISRDRMGNSFIKINNILVRTTARPLPSESILVLLPRCIEKETRKTILGMIEEFHCKSYTATGGSSARKMIVDLKPMAIVAVACERDLLSGLQDVAPKIPVIAIPNKRPEGPCKNTVIDLDFFRDSLFQLTGNKKNQEQA